jgi:hypothetical protein
MDERLAMARFESGEQPVYKAPSWNCSWDCDFFQLCQLDNTSPDADEFKRMVFKKRDVYADHRKSAAE